MVKFAYLFLLSKGIKTNIVLNDKKFDIHPFIASLIHSCQINYDDWSIQKDSCLKILNSGKFESFDADQLWENLNTKAKKEKTNPKLLIDDLHKYLILDRNEDFLSDIFNNYEVNLSTVHKSKGREFDNVYLEDFEITHNFYEELSILYVGLTRVKSSFHFFTLSFSDFSNYYPFSYFKKGYNKEFILVDEDIIDRFSIIKNLISVKLGQQTQLFLINDLLLGDELNLFVSNENDSLTNYFYSNKNKNLKLGSIKTEILKKLTRYFRKEISNKQLFTFGGFKIIKKVTETSDFSNLDQLEEIPEYFKKTKFWISLKFFSSIYLE